MHDSGAAPAADHSASHVSIDTHHHDTSHHGHHPSQHDVYQEIDSHHREHEHPHHNHPHHHSDPPPYTEGPTNPLYQPIYTTPHQAAFYGTMQRTSERCRCQHCMADVRALEAGHMAGHPRLTVPGICEAMVKFVFFMVWIAMVIFIVSAALRTWRGCSNFPNRAGCHW